MISFGLGGISLVAGVAFAGHYMGQNASAHGLTSGLSTNNWAKGLPTSKWADVVSPSTTIMRKSSLLGNLSLDEIKALSKPTVQTVKVSAKGEYLIDHSLITGRTDRLARLQNLIVSPPTWKLEQSFKLGQAQKRKIFAARRTRLAQSECLARAIYFEARGESELGQLAVAKVILNRVKSSKFPSNICGVIYQGSHRKNSCQFSFACDGKTDVPKYGKPWRKAKVIASRALAGGNDLRIISTATFYHADYVNPKWAGAMDRLIKIGTHIFYRGS